MLHRSLLLGFCVQLLLQIIPVQSACPASTVNECSSNPCANGVCVDGYNRFICNCNPGYSGPTCDKALPTYDGTTCEDVYQKIRTGKSLSKGTALPDSNGPYSIQPGTDSFRAYCDFSDSCYQWTVIQRRSGCEVPFYRNWTEYQTGFGHPSGDYWIGNDHLNQITTKNTRTLLRVELTDWAGVTCYEEYDNFKVADASDKYRLISAGNFTGTCGDSFIYHVGSRFSTFDQDNDVSTYNCAFNNQGAWWYNACFQSNLNALYFDGGAGVIYQGIIWYTGKNSHTYSYKTAVMKIREY